jgi:radical SAM superfamily enzyme YgiQ (UPF0313 family)
MTKKIRRNVLLVYPPIDSNYYTEGVNDSPPLGLVALQNYAGRNMPEPAAIRIIDGEHNSLARILDIIAGGGFDMVGIQPMMASYKSSLKIAEAAKQTGALVILGGHHATQLARQIVKNRKKIIDYVVTGDGEQAFVSLLENKPVHTIPNIVYWDEPAGRVIATPTANVPIDEGRITHFSRDLLDQYKRNDVVFERGGASSFRSYSHKGCGNRMNSEYCFFCGRADRGLRLKTPTVYMDELRYLSKVHKAVYIFEIGDDFLQDAQWLKEIARLKQNRYPDIDSHLKIFSRANRITPGIIKLLKELDVDEVAIGFESGSEKILRNINKNITPGQNVTAARLLFSNGIDAVASFVLGLPGEDDRSLKSTYDLAMQITDLSHSYLGRAPREVIANLIEINPGAPSFKKLQKAFPHKYCRRDLFDIRETQDDYFREIFGLESPAEIDERRAVFAGWSKKINRLGQYTFPAGWEKDDMN